MQRKDFLSSLNYIWNLSQENKVLLGIVIRNQEFVQNEIDYLMEEFKLNEGTVDADEDIDLENDTNDPLGLNT